MDVATLIKLAIVASIVLLVFAIGLSAQIREVVAFVRAPLAATKAMVAMFVAMPMIALAIVWLLPLDAVTVVTLLALTVSPMPPIYPGKAGRLGGGDRYVMSLFVLASVVTLAAAPLLLALYARLLGVVIPFDSLAVFRTILVTIIAPLCAGLMLAEFAPAFAARLSGLASRVGSILLAGGVAVALIAAFPAMLLAAGNFTLVAIVVMVVLGMAAGHLLGGPGDGNRAALATATALRHPGVAVALALGASVPGSRAVVGIVIFYLLVNTVVGLLYARWLKTRTIVDPA